MRLFLFHLVLNEKLVNENQYKVRFIMAEEVNKVKGQLAGSV